MSTRVRLRIENRTGKTVRCKDISCQGFNDLSVGVTIPKNGHRTFESSTNHRIFVTWEWESGPAAWEMGMTCPQLSDNSAYGSARAGLQRYAQKGTPAQFTYILGEDNQADWGNGGGHLPTAGLRYGDCSRPPG